MDSTLKKNQPKLRILIFSAPLKMLTDSNCFLDKMIQILRNLRSKTLIKKLQELLVYTKQTLKKTLDDRIKKKIPWALRILRVLLPVTLFTCAIPWESRRITPMWDGVNPFLAILQMDSSTYTDPSTQTTNYSQSNIKRPSNTITLLISTD